MKLRQFVSGSAVVLGVWLGITFFHEVPTQRYPKLDKYRKSAETRGKSNKSGANAADAGTELFQVSVSP
jgi:hypothetical protein